MSVSELLAGKRVCVCGGAGGVGKTTSAAAIALGMAAQGARVGVVTIDPAKRLANALGLDELDNEPRQVDPRALGSAGAAMRGELWAMMLDPKRTFDELIEHLAPTPERAEEIKANRVYRELSTAVAGSQEFTAVAKLYELHQDGDFDLLVLDTPPSRNAMDFLDAPARLTSFLEGRALRAFLRPTGFGMRVLGRGASPFLGVMRRVTGVDLISDLTTFFTLLGGMTEAFGRRAKGVEEMLRAPSTAVLVVSSAQREPLEEAIWFGRTLREGGLPFTGVIVNRVHHDLLGATEQIDGEIPLPPGMGADLGRRLAENLRDYHLLAQRDEANIARLAAELPGKPMLLVPHFDDDVHDVEGLLRVQRYLFASDTERATMLDEVVA